MTETTRMSTRDLGERLPGVGHEGHAHEWRGQGRGQVGDSGVAICREHPDGRTRVQRRGYLRALPGGRGWVEGPWRLALPAGWAATWDDDDDVLDALPGEEVQS